MKTYIRFRPSMWFVFTLMINLNLSHSALAVDRYVDPAGANAVGCSDPANPCQTIAYAITQAVAGDTIRLMANGPGVTTFFENNLTIPVDLIIRGDGAFRTEIDAQDLDRIFNIDSTMTVIDGVTLRNGNAGFNNGGAIELNTGDLFVIRSRFLDNESNAAGGAIAADADAGEIYISFSTLRGNRSSSSGGAVWCDECTGVNLLFNNIVDNLAGGLGGAIYAWGTEVLASTSYISRNTADGGGGIYGNYALVQVLDSEMTANAADTLDGGAISTAGTLNIQRSTLADNTAANQGGAVYMVGDGGFASGNTTFSGNNALCGGGIALNVNFGPGADVLVGTSTFVDNDSTFPGCAEHIFGGWNSFELYNSILANDPAGGPYDPYCSSILSDGTNNLIDDASCDTGGATFNLGVVSNIDFNLAYNGGISRTHNLLSGSNAIDAGFNPACLNPWTGAPLVMDQRTQTRPVDSDGSGIAECDIGSVELQ
jgi:hypothetical protein